MTAEQAQKYVRAHWDSCDVEDHRLCCGGLAWRPVIEPHWSAWCDTASKAWLAAAEYTRAHEQKIAEKREEIGLIREYIETSKAMDAVERLPASDHTAVFERVLATLEAQLAELLRGWRQP